MARGRTVLLGMVLVVVATFGLWNLWQRRAHGSVLPAIPETSWYEQEVTRGTEPHPRIEDGAELFGRLAHRLNHDLDALSKDLGIDMRVITSTDGRGSIERQANELFRARKVGEGAPTGGVLILMNTALSDARIEVSYSLEPTFTDAICGRLARTQLAPYASYGVAWMAVMDVIHYLRDIAFLAVMRHELEVDPQFRDTAAFHEKERFYSGGAGAKTALLSVPMDADLKQRVPPERRPRYTPSSHVEDSLQSYLHVLEDLAGDPTLDLFTEGSRIMRAHYPVAPFEEVERLSRIQASAPLEFQESEDYAVAISNHPATGFVPVLFQREHGLWRVDLVETWKNFFFQADGSYYLRNANNPYGFGLRRYGSQNFFDVAAWPVAEGSLERTLAKEPDGAGPIPRLMRGELLFRNCFLIPEALQEYEKARRLAPEDPLVLDKLSDRALYLYLPELAIPALLKIGFGSELRLAEAYRSMGDFDGAERWARRALEVNPYDTTALWWLQNALQMEGQKKEAAEVGRRIDALRADPEKKSEPVILTFSPPRPRIDTEHPVQRGSSGLIYDHSEFSVTMTNTSYRPVEIEFVILESRGDDGPSGLGDIRNYWQWPASPGRLEAREAVTFWKLWGFTVDTRHTHVRYVFHVCWHGQGPDVRQCRTQSIDTLPS